MSKVDKHANNPKKLISILQSGSYQERARAAFHLGSLQDRTHLTVLKEALKDPVPNVVKEVVEALKKTGTDAEADRLISERQKEIFEEGTATQERIASQWKEKTEEEKQAELERYAANSHIRANQRKMLKTERELNVDWRIAAIVFGLIALFGSYFMGWLPRFF